MVRIGIIGLGFMGRMHYGTYEKIPGARVVAVSDPSARKAAGDLGEGWGNVPGAEIRNLPMDRIRGTTDWQELLGWEDVDVVDVCIPTPAHVEVATAALAAGKHVVCEKPLARTSAEAQVIADAAEKARGFFMPAMCMRFWGEWEWLKRAADEQRYGPVRSAVFRRMGGTPQGWFRDGSLSGGGILDLHIHDVDFVYHLFGKPKGVFSRGYAKDTGQIDHVLSEFLYDQPALVAAEGAWGLAPGYGFRMGFTVNFERATADFETGRQRPLMVYGDKGQIEIDAPTHDGYTGELSYFLNCVTTRTPPRRVTARDAVTSIQIVEAEKRSIATGAAVML